MKEVHTKADKRLNTDLNRCRKMVKTNTELHHKMQRITKQPVLKKWDGKDEIIAGNDDQRFVRESEIGIFQVVVALLATLILALGISAINYRLASIDEATDRMLTDDAYYQQVLRAKND